MKNLFFLLLSISLLAQEREVKLGDFDELKVFDGLNITMTPSTENKLVISGENNQYVQVNNKNGTLKLRMKLKKRFSGFSTNIEIFFNNTIQVIDANEGAFVSAPEALMQPYILLKTQEGAEIDAVLDVQKLDVKAVSGGIVNVKGAAMNQQVNINSGGTLEAVSLETNQTSVRISAGGEARIKASKFVDAEVRAGGFVYIYGKPEQVNKNILIGGSILETESE